jgi:hypothetical protein
LIDGANAEERREHEPGDQGADNPHHDIQKQALLRIGAHDDAGNPPQDALMIIHSIKFMARFSALVPFDVSPSRVILLDDATV